MKVLTRIRVYSLVMMGVLIVLIHGCKKADEERPPYHYSFETGTVTDIDGNVYNTVKIGTQWWMAENLRTTRLNDNTPIPMGIDSTLTNPGYRWPSWDDQSRKKYGALYNWFTVDTKKLAPVGWHVPSASDWSILIYYLGGKTMAAEACKEGYIDEDGYGYNEHYCGFAARSVGVLGEEGSVNFFLYSVYAGWWTSTGNSTYGRIIIITNGDMWQSSEMLDKSVPNTFGVSVRCVKD